MNQRGRWVFLFVFGILVFYTGIQAHRLMPEASQAKIWMGVIVFFWGMLGGQYLYRLQSLSKSPRWISSLVWSGMFFFGAWGTFMMASLLIEGAFLLRALMMGGWFEPSRNIFIAALIFSFVLALLGLRESILGPLVRDVPVPVTGLPLGIQGFRIVQISDLHVGPTIGEKYVERVVDQVLDLKPDLIAMTGDLADGNPEALKEKIRPLSRLKAPLSVFYVTGNHEYYWGAEAWVKKMREMGIVPLIDENKIVTHNGCQILVGGICDSSAPFFVATHKSDVALAGKSPGVFDFKILLAHRPNSCVEAEKAGFDLQLSGHTHGGQFFPLSLLIGFFHRYSRGLNRCGKMWVYVNSGTGYWGPPNRLGVASEITLLRLVESEFKKKKKDKLEIEGLG